MAKKNKIRTKTANIDYGLLGALILLAAFGLVMGYSASGYLAAKKGLDVYWFFAKQGLIGGVCFLMALLISKADYHVLWYLRWLMMAGAAGSILLLMVDRFSVNKNGATRWLEFFGVSVQPSEIAKIALIVFVPAIAVKMGQEFKGILPSIAALIPGTLLAAETYLISKDLSSAVIIFAIGFFITFAAHPKSYGFFIVGAVVLIAAAAGVFYIWSRVTPDAAESFRVTRLLIWKDPAAFEGGTGEQTIMGLYAIGNGGLFGKGLGNSTMKLGQLSEAGNDWVFAVICEELGFFGALLVVLLFIFLLFRILIIAINAPDTFGALMAAGVFSHIALQAILHIAVTVNFSPPTGVTLPFFSFGGTSLLITMMEMAIVMSISRQITAKANKQIKNRR